MPRTPLPPPATLPATPSAHSSANSSATPLGPRAPGLTVLILSALLGLQPITTDLYLPALPALTQGFGAAMPQAQLTLTALLLSFGVSQLVWGPLSDRFGRRPILLIGLSAYVLASVACTLAPSMAALIFWRAVQGAAMGAGVMCARAIVRDLYSPAMGARVMSKGLSGLAVVACASAPLGGWLSELFSWRIALLTLAIFGAAALALVALRFEETVAQKNPHALAPVTLLHTWGVILRNPTFLAFSALSMAAYGGLFTYLAASSFVLIQVLGLSTTRYGLVMFGLSLAYMAGTFLCRWLLPRLGVKRAVALAAGCSLAGGSALAALYWAGVVAPWAIVAPMLLFLLAHGVLQPCAQSGAVGPFPQAAGAASALNGFAMALTAFAVGGWLGTHMDGTPAPLAFGVAFWSALIALTAWTLVQKQGMPHANPTPAP